MQQWPTAAYHRRLPQPLKSHPLKWDGDLESAFLASNVLPGNAKRSQIRLIRAVAAENRKRLGRFQPLNVSLLQHVIVTGLPMVIIIVVEPHFFFKLIFC